MHPITHGWDHPDNGTERQSPGNPIGRWLIAAIGANIVVAIMVAVEEIAINGTLHRGALIAVINQNQEIIALALHGRPDEN